MSVFVFDNDDTCVRTEWLYSQTIIQFFAYLYEIFQEDTPGIHALVGRYFQIADALYPTYGVRRGRVTKTMEVMYREVYVKVYGKEVLDTAYLEHIQALSDRIFDHTRYPWISEARKVLTALKEQGHALCLLSLYDTSEFSKRLEVLGSYEFFLPERTHAVEFKKTTENFILVSGWTPAKDKDTLWFVVGNRPSDILPALEISKQWRGVYIPYLSSLRLSDSGNARQDEKISFLPPHEKIHDRCITIPSMEYFFSAVEELSSL